MEILVTGAAGFIGHQVVRSLVQQGHIVHAVVRPGSKPWRLDGVPGIKMHEVPLESAADVQQMVRSIQPQSCFHLAWPHTGDLASSAHFDFVRQSMDLALILAGSGCEQFVGTGTNYEYDCTSCCVSELTPAHPHTVYAEAKLVLHSRLKELEHRFPIRTTWVRPFFLYGPFEDSRRLVPSVILALLAARPIDTTAGTHIRDFLHVEDVARGICVAAERGLRVVNIGSGIPISIKDLVTKLSIMLHGQHLLRIGALPQRAGEPECVYADNTLLLQNGWQPRFDLEAGLHDTIQWWAQRST